MSRFFIDRPIFAWVIAIIIMLAGLLSISTLPITQYPVIAPTTIQIKATYPGASAKTLEDTVTQIIEQKMKGLDNLAYISSSSDSSGSAIIKLTFDAKTNPDIAQINVQNKLQLAMSLLPQEIHKQGIQVSKISENFLMVIGFYSENETMSRIDLSDYVASHILEVLSRVDGVGDVTLFGSPYAMRIWLDPVKLASFNLMPSDIKAAIQAQNAQVSAGQLGGTPAVKGQQLNASISVQNCLQTPEQFGKVLLKIKKDGSALCLKDVAHIELGSENYDIVSRFNGKSAVGLAVKLSVGANALKTAELVRNQLANLVKTFPVGMKSVIPYDTTPFVRISIQEVVKTLFEAIILVFIVMYLFLQNFRATLIPTIAVPVVLLGTFGVLAFFGYTINTLTMFSTVLAIGLLVDDAIVVVENVERVIREEGLLSKEATRKSMNQITRALLGIAIVLSAVFIPTAFFSGSTGVIYRQFSITIASAMILSVLVALIFTPALCATILKPGRRLPSLLGQKQLNWFNHFFHRGTFRFQKATISMVRNWSSYLTIYIMIVVVMMLLFWRIPRAFLPDEDQGFMFTMVQLPCGATQERTLKVVEEVEKYFLEYEKNTIKSLFTVVGFSFAGQGQNMGIAFINLRDWAERTRIDHKVKAVVGRAIATFSRIKDARVFAFTPPAILELGNAQGFDVQLQDRAGLGHDALIAARNQFLAMAIQNPKLVAVRPNGQDDAPQYHLIVDQAKAGAMGVLLSDINNVLVSALGGSYINDFIDKGRVKRVYMQGEAISRMLPADLNKWHVRNIKGEMVSFSAFATACWANASPRLERYNGLPSIEILGQPASGISTGEAMYEIEAIASRLPIGISYQWTGLSYQERLSGSQAPILYVLSILVVFLSLAALYESWYIPFVVLLIVPLGVIGALFSVSLCGLPNDIYFQIGFLTTIGLTAKNAILIVEFARELEEKKNNLLEATLEAARLRLRPIIITSLAFILGVLPLTVSRGVGSAAQNAIGTGVMGGMISATLLGTIFVPFFYILVRRFFSRNKEIV